MEFRIVIDSAPSANATAQQAAQTTAAGASSALPWATPAFAAPTAMAPEVAQAKAREQFLQEIQLRHDRLAVMREQHQIDTAAMVASRRYEEEVLVRNRSLEILKERNKIEGAALEDAKHQMASEKERSQYAARLDAERRKLDPAGAMGSDVGQIGGLLGQLSGGKGLGGLLGKFGEMVPQFQGAFEKYQQTMAARGAAGGMGEAAKAAGSGAEAASGMGKAAGGAAEMLGAAGGEAAGAAGGMGGALGGVAAAAGPAGMIYQGMRLAVDYQKEQIQEQTESMREFGRQVQRVAQNDHLGALTTGIDGAANSMGKMGLGWELMGERVKQFSEGIRTAASVVDSFVQRGAALEAFNGSIAQQRAMADVRSLLGDIREAGTVGGSIASITKSSSKLEDNMREALEPLKLALAESVAIPLQLLADVVGGVVKELRDSGTLEEWKLMIRLVSALAREWLKLKKEEKKEESMYDLLAHGGFGQRVPVNDIFEQAFGFNLPPEANRVTPNRFGGF